MSPNPRTKVRILNFRVISYLRVLLQLRHFFLSCFLIINSSSNTPNEKNNYLQNLSDQITFHQVSIFFIVSIMNGQTTHQLRGKQHKRATLSPKTHKALNPKLSNWAFVYPSTAMASHPKWGPSSIKNQSLSAAREIDIPLYWGKRVEKELTSSMPPSFHEGSNFSTFQRSIFGSSSHGFGLSCFPLCFFLCCCSALVSSPFPISSIVVRSKLERGGEREKKN